MSRAALLTFHQSSKRLKIRLGIHGAFDGKTRSPSDSSITASCIGGQSWVKELVTGPILSLIELDGADY
jgi:hypothetical protein